MGRFRVRAATAATATTAVAVSVMLAVPASANSAPAAGQAAPVNASNLAFAWGYNGFGTLGDGTDLDRATPGQVLDLSEVSFVAANDFTAYAVRRDGTVWSWGRNSNGQLGDGTVTADRRLPVQAVGLTDVASVAANGTSAYAVRHDGTVWSWGNNFEGQLGDGTTTQRPAPAPIDGLSDVVAVAASSATAFAVRADGTLWGWGLNDAGQLGDGTTTNRPTPTLLTGIADVVAVAAGADTGYALRNDGTVWAWGAGAEGQLGNGSATGSIVPVQVVGIYDVTALAATGATAFAVRGDRSVWAWGANDNGLLGSGHGNVASRRTPVEVVGLHDVVTVAAGASTGYALRSDGTVWAWGYNAHGELGSGDPGDSNPVPGQVVGLYQVTAIAAGRAAYALTATRPPTARLSVTPTSDVAPWTVEADATASSPGGAPIAAYTFDFGDGSPPVGPQAAPIVPHDYLYDGTYVVHLTVVDSTGIRSRQRATVVVGTATPSMTVGPGPSEPFCPHCATMTITSTGPVPLVVIAVVPGEHSMASIYRNDCIGVLEVGESCVIRTVVLPGPSWETNTDLVVTYNGPGGQTVI